MPKLRFTGQLEELSRVVREAGFTGNWTEREGGQQQFKADNRACMNWWPTTGTINFGGPLEAREQLQRAIETLLTASAEGPGDSASSLHRDRKIFVVHGHDQESRDQLELALRRLGLEPFILINSTGEGKTIIEALEGHIGRDFSSAFGIVLMTPDDRGCAAEDGPEKVEPRARQNVVLETGMLLASLTRSRMALLVRGHLELPSDLQGLIQFRFNQHIREIMPKLCRRLSEVGIQIEQARISEACS